jgi:SAM-dependent methyltransferase
MVFAARKESPQKQKNRSRLHNVALLCVVSSILYVIYDGGWRHNLDNVAADDSPTDGLLGRILASMGTSDATTNASCSSTVVIPPVPLRKGNRRKFTDEEYIASAVRLVDSIRLLIGVAKSDALPEPSSTSLDGLVIMDYGCGPGRFLVGLSALGVCYQKYIGVDVGAREIDWLTTTHPATSSGKKNQPLRKEFIRVDVQNDRYNKNGKTLDMAATDDTQALIFSPQQTEELAGTVDVMILRSVFSHMLSKDISHHLKALQPLLNPKTGVMAVSLFVRPDTDETVLSQNDNQQALHIVVISKQAFEAMVYSAGYHILLYTTLMGQETYILAPGTQSAPKAAA